MRPEMGSAERCVGRAEFFTLHYAMLRYVHGGEELERRVPASSPAW